MSIFPQQTIIGTLADGSQTRLEVWNFDDLRTLEIARRLILIFLCFFIVGFIAPLLLLFSLFELGSDKEKNLWGMIISFVFLLDCHFGFWCSGALSMLFNWNGIAFFIGLNVASLITHAIIYFYGGEELRKSRIFILVIIVAVGLIVGKSVAKSIGSGRYKISMERVEFSKQYKIEQDANEKEEQDRMNDGRWSNL